MPNKQKHAAKETIKMFPYTRCMNKNLLNTFCGINVALWTKLINFVIFSYKGILAVSQLGFAELLLNGTDNWIHMYVKRQFMEDNIYLVTGRQDRANKYSRVGRQRKRDRLKSRKLGKLVW